MPLFGVLTVLCLSLQGLMSVFKNVSVLAVNFLTNKISTVVTYASLFTFCILPALNTDFVASF